MFREEARQEIRRRINCEQYLEKSKSGLYCCPFCGSGTGQNGTGALKLYKTNTWTCHACKKSGDVIDLYQQETGADYNTALSLLAQELGIEITPYSPQQSRPEAKTEPIEAADYTKYYQQCRERLSDPAAVSYLQSRGISLDTAKAYWIGFDPAADPANAPGGSVGAKHPCPRLIIPTSKTHYVGRRTDGNPAFAKVNAKGSSPAIFNLNALYAQDVQEVFVVEGAIDALSILEAGYTAIALNSAGNGKLLLQQIELRRPAATIILCPDNDKDPKTAETVKAQFKAIADGLQRLNIAHITANVAGEYKDANEALVKGKMAFTAALEEAQRRTAAKPDNTAYYIDALMSAEIARFKSDKKTGFANLDAKAGGLYSGLYVLAAVSSLGKTSFALQLADQLAENGSDVIFFSLEQSRLELVSKSIARRTAQKSMAQAVTSLAIRKGYLPKQVLAATEAYKNSVADRISIVEGNFACDITFIGDYVREYIRKTGKRPVVIIDYLQILQPAEAVRRSSTKEVIDFNVTALKRLSREDLTIIAISSINRSNYLSPIDFESLKESGSIEFSADVVWGLQLQCLNDPKFEKAGIIEQRKMVKKAKAETPRMIELSCLKNRYGISNYSCYFEYYPANDLFLEGMEIERYTDTPKAGRKLQKI